MSRRPVSVGEGVLVALGAAIAAPLLWGILPLLLPPGWALRCLISLLSLGYLGYLLARGQGRAGRLVMVALWTLTTGVALALPLGIGSLLLLQLGLLWLVRALYHQSTPLGALLDLGLIGLGLLVGRWAWVESGSLFLAIWSLMLVQALFPWIPSSGTGNRDRHTPDPFNTAEQAAARAIRRLTDAA